MGASGLARERVYRVLLNNPEGLPRHTVAEEAGVDAALADGVLRDLEARGTVSGTAVRDYLGLAEHWASTREPPKMRRYHVSADPLEILRGSGMRYALTTYQAENMVQLYLLASITEFYAMPDDVGRWHELLRRDGAAGKVGVRMWVADDHVFYGSIEARGKRMVSVPQLIVDLMSRMGPTTEAALMLAREMSERRGHVGVPELRA